ncbi:MAG: hypothetical protein IPL84_13640 [Chitinophagaceae bacterium]|nr:hypothetical protein [Chitinophagaceae bacterium]
MKKRISFKIAALLAFAIVILQFACKHEIQVPECDGSFSITAIQTPATLNQNNGTISATASGGTGFSFSLNGGPFQDTGYFSGLEPFRTYNLVGKNSYGCTDTLVIQIDSYDPCQGITITVSLTKTDASPGQSNGSITATATGGTGFTFSLNNGPFQNTNTFSNLAAGSYVVAAKSLTGCIGLNQITIGTNNPCAGITVVVTTTVIQPTTGQTNGSITASATGGSGFTYSINNGAFQASGVFNNLAAGNYTITAKNSNGCTGITTVALGSANPCAGVTVVVSTTQVDPTSGQSNGSITATAAGGTGFTYSLNSGIFQASGTFSNLAAGTYTITAKNSNGCLGSKQVILTATNPCNTVNISITAAVVKTTPCVTPANNGSITITATGSTGFTYNINGGAYQTSNAFLNLNAGNYLMGVKDVNGCTKTQSVTVGVTPGGPLFLQVRNLVSSRCNGSSCHIGSGQNAAGYNFDSDCNIVSKWNQINQTSVLYGNGWVRMPKNPQPLLTAAEKAIITNWVNAGHKITD